MARKIRKFAQGGDASQQVRFNRKVADIESDYQKALKAGRSNGIATAKYEQRMADARDDLAKWTRSDRTETRAAESAAERALSEARRTKGVSALRSKTPTSVSSLMDEGPVGVTSGAEVGRVASPSTTRATPRPRAAAPAPTPRRSATSPAPRRVAAPDLSTANAALDRVGEFVSGFGRRSQPRAAPAAAGKSETDKSTVSPIRRFLASMRDPTEQGAALPYGGRLRANPGKMDLSDDGSLKKGGKVKKFAKGGSVDGCAVRGKTRIKRK